MAIGLVGQKLGMTRLLSDDGSASSVSVIKIEPNRIVQTKTIDTDGYNPVQVTIGKKINKNAIIMEDDLLIKIEKNLVII